MKPLIVIPFSLAVSALVAIVVHEVRPAGALAGRADSVAIPIGYTAEAIARTRALEARFRGGVSADRVSQYHKAVTARPHIAGSEGSQAVAEHLRRSLTEAGLQVEVLEYQAYLSTPTQVAIDLVAPVTRPLRVTEPPSDVDRDSSHRELGPGFVAYSASGDVTAPAVYVNYGLPSDYAALRARGVDVSGKLAFARYGRSHRAVKVHTAQEAGAVGLVIYSDPADDGFVRGETWPNGYWRTGDMIQRGNAKYSWFWHGDPLTPGVAAVAGATRLDPAHAPTLPRIPVGVLSWGEAQQILERLDGGAVPAGFQGGLPFTYRMGGSDAVRLRLRVQMDDGLRTIRNVIARVPGARLADREIVFGTHHDAWTFGGVDPGTGIAALLELGRGLGALRAGGWTPERTITLAFWDAEEFGLIGSTEYAEQRAEALRAGGICYINTDLYMEGRLDVGGGPSLRDFLVQVTKDVPEPARPATERADGAPSGATSVYDAWLASEWPRQPIERRRRGRAGFEVDLKPLGSGADFVPFQAFLGLPTLSIEYIGAGGYGFGTYHSNYDSRFYAERIADPGFMRGAQLVRVLGTVALRLGESQVLPYRFSHYASRLGEFVNTASTWATDDDGAPVVAVDVRGLKAAVQRIAAQAATLEQRIDAGLASGRLPSSQTAALNDRLARLEQALVDTSEPPDRRWFRHVVYGWNIYSMYDGQPFPALADAVRLRDARRVRDEVARIAAALDRLQAGLRDATALAEDRRP